MKLCWVLSSSSSLAASVDRGLFYTLGGLIRYWEHRMVPELEKRESWLGSALVGLRCFGAVEPSVLEVVYGVSQANRRIADISAVSLNKCDG